MARRPTAFIIHGRDVVARDVIAAFLKQVGFRVIPFGDRSLGLKPNAFIADIVLAALRKADVLIALFTPDEQAALYDSHSGRLVAGEARWQARQNVIFEAGVAFGVHREKTILVTVGADVQLFSDLAGVHFVKLLDPGGDRVLLDKLRMIVPRIRGSRVRKSVAFKKLARKRWIHYDELETLLLSFGACRLGKGKYQRTLLEVMRKVVASRTDWTWTSNPKPRALMEAIDEEFSEGVTNAAYWWLVVYGFFQFESIDQFYDGEGEDWDDSVDYCAFSPRAVRLWERLA